MSSRLFDWNREEIPFGMSFAEKCDTEVGLDGHYDPDRQLFVNPNGTPIFGGMTSTQSTHYFWTIYPTMRDKETDFDVD